MRKSTTTFLLYLLIFLSFCTFANSPKDESPSIAPTVFKYDSASRNVLPILLNTQEMKNLWLNQVLAGDPLRFSIQASKQEVAVDEEFELKITVSWANLTPSMLFTFEELKEYSLKVITPKGFIQTGGDYQDYVSGKIDPENPQRTYIIKGKFTEKIENPAFLLIRGAKDIYSDNLFVKKGEINVNVKGVFEEKSVVFDGSREQTCNFTISNINKTIFDSMGSDYLTFTATSNINVATGMAKFQIKQGNNIVNNWRDDDIILGLRTTDVSHNFSFCSNSNNKTYDIYLLAVDANGLTVCQNAQPITITINSIPCPPIVTPSYAIAGTQFQADCGSVNSAKWYKLETSQLPVEKSSGLNYVPTEAGFYWVRCYDSNLPLIMREGSYTNFLVQSGASITIKASNLSICGTETSTLEATTNECNTSIIWYKNGSSVNNTVSEISIGATQVGTYHATCGSATSNPVTITANGVPSPPIILTNKYNITYGEIAKLTATGCDGGVHWYGGDYNGMNADFITTSKPGGYYAKCHNYCGTSEASQAITITQGSIRIESDKAVVPINQPVTLTVYGCGGYVKWKDPYGVISTITNPKIFYGPGTYQAQCISVGGDASEWVSINIGTSTMPVPIPSSRPTMGYASTTIQLSATGCEPYTYLWDIKGVAMWGSSVSTNTGYGTYYVKCFADDYHTSPYVAVTVKEMRPESIVINSSQNEAFPTENVTLWATGCNAGGIKWEFIDNSGQIQTLWTSTTETINIKGPRTYYAWCHSGNDIGDRAEKKINPKQPGSLVIYANKSSATSSEVVTFTADGCPYGIVQWKKIINSTTSEEKSGRIVDFFGYGTYEAYCTNGGVSGPKSTIQILPKSDQDPTIVINKTRVFPWETYTVSVQGCPNNSVLLIKNQNGVNEYIWDYQLIGNVQGAAKFSALCFDNGKWAYNETFAAQGNGLRIIADKYKVGATENVTLTAYGCDFGTVEWRNAIPSATTGTKTLYPPDAFQKVMNGPGYYEARCKNDTWNNGEWVMVSILPSTNVEPTFNGPTQICSGLSYQLIANNCPSGYGYQWKTIENGWNNWSAITTITQPQTIQVRCIKNDGSFWYPSKFVEIAPIFPQDFRTVNSGPIKTGQPIRLTATPVPNALYKWAGPNGINTDAPDINNRFFDITNATMDHNGIYTVTVSITGCETSATTEVKVTDCNFSLVGTDKKTGLFTTTLTNPVCESLELTLYNSNDEIVSNGNFEWVLPNNTRLSNSTNNLSIKEDGTYTLNYKSPSSFEACPFTIKIDKISPRTLDISQSYDAKVNGLTAMSLSATDKNARTETTADFNASITPVKYYNSDLIAVRKVNGNIPPYDLIANRTESRLLAYYNNGQLVEYLIRIIPESAYNQTHTDINISNLTGDVRVYNIDETSYIAGWRFNNGNSTQTLPFSSDAEMEYLNVQSCNGTNYSMAWRSGRTDATGTGTNISLVNAESCIMEITSSENNIVSGNSVSLTATGCNGIVTWSNGQNGTTITVNPTTKTTYTAICEIGTGSNKVTCAKSMTINVYNSCPSFVINTSSPNVVEIGQTVSLTASGCNGSITWEKGLGSGSVVSQTILYDTYFGAICNNADGSSCLAKKTISVTSCMGEIDYLNFYFRFFGLPISMGRYTLFTVKGCENGRIEWELISGKAILGGGYGEPNLIDLDANQSRWFSDVKSDLRVKAVCKDKDNNIICEKEATSRKPTYFDGDGGSYGGYKKLAINAYISVNSKKYNSYSINNDAQISLNVSSCPGIVKWGNNLNNQQIEGKEVFFEFSSIDGQTIHLPDETTTYYAYCHTGGKVIPSNPITLVKNNTCFTIKNSLKTINQGEAIDLQVVGCLGTVSWDNNLGNNASVRVTPAVTTTYKATCSNPNCSDNAVITVIPCSSLKINTSTNKNEVKIGETIALRASGCSAGTITWNTTQIGNEIIVSPIENKTYTATCGIGNCSGSINITVTPNLPKDITCEDLVIQASPTDVYRGEKNIVTLVAQGCSDGNVSWNNTNGVVTWLNGKTGASVDISTQDATTIEMTCQKPGLGTRSITLAIPAKTRFEISASNTVVKKDEYVDIFVKGCLNGTISWNTGESCSLAPCKINKKISQTTEYTATCSVSGLSPIIQKIKIYIKNASGGQIVNNGCVSFYASIAPKTNDINILGDLKKWTSSTPMELKYYSCPTKKVSWVNLSTKESVTQTVITVPQTTTFEATCLGSDNLPCAFQTIEVPIYKPVDCSKFTAKAEVVIGSPRNSTKMNVVYDKVGFVFVSNGCTGKVIWTNTNGEVIDSQPSYLPAKVDSPTILATCTPNEQFPTETCPITVQLQPIPASQRQSTVPNSVADTYATQQTNLATVAGVCGSVDIKGVMVGYIKHLCENIALIRDNNGNITQEKAAKFVELTEKALREQLPELNLVFPTDKTAIINSIVSNNCEQAGTLMLASTSGSIDINSYNTKKNATYKTVSEKISSGLLSPASDNNSSTQTCTNYTNRYYISPDGKAILLPAGYKPLTFHSWNFSYSPPPSGSLQGFIDDNGRKYFAAQPYSGRFQGYKLLDNPSIAYSGASIFVATNPATNYTALYLKRYSTATTCGYSGVEFSTKFTPSTDGTIVEMPEPQGTEVCSIVVQSSNCNIQTDNLLQYLTTAKPQNWLKAKGLSNATLYLANCNTGRVVQVTTQGETTLDGVSANQAKANVINKNFNTDYAIYACIGADGNWDIVHNFKNGSLKIPAGYTGTVAEVEQRSNAAANQVIANKGIKDDSPLSDGELYYEKLDVIKALVAVKDATMTLCNYAKVPEKFWDDRTAEYAQAAFHGPTLSGVADGAVSELKDIPELVGFGLDIATDPAKAKATWNGIKSLTPAKVKKMLLGAATAKIQIYTNGGNPMKHEAGKDGVQIAMFVVGAVASITANAGRIAEMGGAADEFAEIADDAAASIGNAVEETTHKSIAKDFKDGAIDGVGADKSAADVANAASRKGSKLTLAELKALWARGNAFNRKAIDNAWYRFNEVWLEHPTKVYPIGHKNAGKPMRFRLDSYDNGKIVSRKATTLSEIQQSTFEKYLKELVDKYPVGSKIANPNIGTTLNGNYFLEIPDINANFPNLASYRNIASNFSHNGQTYNIQIILKPE